MSLHRDPVGEHGGDYFTRDSEVNDELSGDGLKKILETGLSLHTGPIG